MNAILDSIRRMRGLPDALAGEADHWRRVPKINVLPRRVPAVAGRAGVRRVLLAVIVVAALLLGLVYRNRNSDESAIESTRTQVQQVQKQIASEQQSLEQLQNEVEALRKQVDTAEQAFKQVTAGRTMWYSGLSAILEARADDIVFESMKTIPGGEVVLTGAASDLGAMARFQERLRARPAVRLQAFSFSNGASILRFTATLKVVQ